MDERKQYQVKAVRSDGWWALSVPEIRGVHSQARRLDEAEAMARDAIALALEVPDDTFDVELVPHVDDATDRAIQDAVEARTAVELAGRKLREAVRVATTAGVPVRDIAWQLGVSFQYVAKLAAAPTTTPSS